MPDTNPKWPSREEIERRARQKFVERGCENGHEVADWLEAEKELAEFLRANEEPVPAFSSIGPDIDSGSTRMSFLNFYGLREQPFGMTPDPAYLYASRTHSEALASLSRGIADTRGFLALVADPGMGKTTLLYQLIEHLGDAARTVLIFQTDCTSRELIEYILQDLGVDFTGMGLVAMHGKLNEVLFEQLMQGKRFVLVVDEAQNLDDSVLETVRMLSNFETHNAKLMQIILAGQPLLAAKLAQPRLSQLRQRISVLTQLEAFTVEETRQYIEHRLNVAGLFGGQTIFEPAAIKLIARQSRGIPRNINNICHNSMLIAYSRDRRAVNAEIVQEAVAGLDMESLASPPQQTPAGAEPARSVAAVSTKAPASRITTNARAVAAQHAVDRPDEGPRPSLTYGAGPKKNPSAWRMHSAIVVVILFSGALLLAVLGRSESRQRLTPQVFDQASGSLGQSLPSGNAEDAAAYDATPQDTGSGQVLTVAAGPQQSLRDLTLRYVGHFDVELSNQIRSLNPDLKDPDHLVAGQLIRIPLPPGAMKKVNDTADMPAAPRQEASGSLFARLSALLRERK
ncbi:MAG TPA: AAA family ATPase [Candidatus Acidoferrales bacterium]|nr:AAA family ATPase [Candidatus Acidoferrales bacterium]